MNINIAIQLDDKNILGIQSKSNWQYVDTLTASDCKKILADLPLHEVGAAVIAGAVCNALGLIGAAASTAMLMYFTHMAENKFRPFLEKGADGNGYDLYSCLELGPGTVNPSYTLVYKFVLA